MRTWIFARLIWFRFTICRGTQNINQPNWICIAQKHKTICHWGLYNVYITTLSTLRPLCWVRKNSKNPKQGKRRNLWKKHRGIHLPRTGTRAIDFTYRGQQYDMNYNLWTPKCKNWVQKHVIKIVSKIPEVIHDPRHKVTYPPDSKLLRELSYPHIQVAERQLAEGLRGETPEGEVGNTSAGTRKRVKEVEKMRYRNGMAHFNLGNLLAVWTYNSMAMGQLVLALTISFYQKGQVKHTQTSNGF